MVRFRVIKLSQLLVGIAAVILALVICVLAVKIVAGRSEQSVETSLNLVEQSLEAEDAQAAFASSLSVGGMEISVIPSSGEDEPSPSGENEHTDEVVEYEQPLEFLPLETETVPKILIYHTHTHEAYEQAEDDPYVAVEAWRTTDESHSIVRVGAELAKLLEEKGFEVVHDTTDHELNELSTAYTRSLQTVESYSETFDLYIDLHRDAYIEGAQIALTVGDTEYARLMMLIGKGEGFQEKPNYEGNLSFATALTEELNRIQPGICRDVLVKSNRYNQHVGQCAVLIEVGHNRNTLQQALNSMPVLAEGLADLLLAS